MNDVFRRLEPVGSPFYQLAVFILLWELSKGLLRGSYKGVRRLWRYCRRRQRILTLTDIAEEVLTPNLWSTPSGSRLHMATTCKKSFSEGTTLTENRICGYCLSARRDLLMRRIRKYVRQEVEYLESAV